MGIAQALRDLDARLSRYALEGMKAGTGIGYPNVGWQPPSGHVGATSAGIVINEERANTVAAWFAGVRKISQDVAKAPLHVYRREGRNAEKALDLPLYRMLHDAPNPEMTSMVFRETLQAHAIAWGNGYAEMELNGSGRCIAMWPLRPDRMEPAWENGRRVYYYTQRPGERPIRMPAERIFHLPGIGFDGLKGYAILRLARETLGAAINLRDYGNRVVANDARPGTVMHHPGTLSDKARDNLKKGWVEANERDGPGRTALLEEGITLTTLGFPPEDVQFLESQQWQVTEAARWLDIAPHKIGDLSRATFSNIEEQNIDHVVSTLGAWFVRWEQQLNKDVVRDPSLFAEHNLDAALRGKTLERAQANVLKINSGAMVPNEWRGQDNQNPLPWGDERVNTPNNTAGGAGSDDKGVDVLGAVNAAGTLIRSGFDPEASLAAVGLPPISHTGLLPVTVQGENKAADIHVTVPVTVDGVAVSDDVVEQMTGRVVDAVSEMGGSLHGALKDGTASLASAVSATTAAVREDVRRARVDLADTVKEATEPRTTTRRAVRDEKTGDITHVIETTGEHVVTLKVLRDEHNRVIGQTPVPK